MNVDELRTARERGVKPSATGANLTDVIRDELGRRVKSHRASLSWRE